MCRPECSIEEKVWHKKVKGQCFIDWATAVVGEADRELTCVTLTYHSSGPIYEISPYCIEAMSKYEESILNLLKQKIDKEVESKCRVLDLVYTVSGEKRQASRILEN